MVVVGDGVVLVEVVGAVGVVVSSVVVVGLDGRCSVVVVKSGAVVFGPVVVVVVVVVVVIVVGWGPPSHSLSSGSVLQWP